MIVQTSCVNVYPEPPFGFVSILISFRRFFAARHSRIVYAFFGFFKQEPVVINRFFPQFKLLDPRLHVL